MVTGKCYSQIEKGINAPAIRLQLSCNTTDQNTQRMKWCRESLKMFETECSWNVKNIVTGDETWLYYYDVPTKTQIKV